MCTEETISREYASMMQHSRNIDFYHLADYNILTVAIHVRKCLMETAGFHKH